MSKFFSRGDSSASETSQSSQCSDSESSPSSDEEPKQKVAFQKLISMPQRPRRLVSQRDKRFDKMRQTVKQLQNAMKINDWNAISNEFQNLNQQISKARQLIQQVAASKLRFVLNFGKNAVGKYSPSLVTIQEGIPHFYIKTIAQLADHVEIIYHDKDRVKKMSKTNARSLNAMKQNIKKNNMMYEDAIRKYREAPHAGSDGDNSGFSESVSESQSSGSDSVSESGSESDESDRSTASSSESSESDKSTASEFSESSGWPTASSESSGSEDFSKNSQPKGILKWLKQPVADAGSDSDDDDDDGFEQVSRRDKKAFKKCKDKDSKEKDRVESSANEVTDSIVLSEENVQRMLKQIQSTRGKKNVSKINQIGQLELLATATISPCLTAQVLIELIAEQFDISTRQLCAVKLYRESELEKGNRIPLTDIMTNMPISFEVYGQPSREHCMWTKCMGNIRRLLTLFRDNLQLKRQPELADQSPACKENRAHQDLRLDEEFDVGSILASFIEKLDSELLLSLWLLDNHVWLLRQDELSSSPEMLERLRDIVPFLEVAELAQEYCQFTGQQDAAARIAIRRLEHVYFWPESLVAIAPGINQNPGDLRQGREKYIHEIAMQVYRYGNDSVRIRALLCHVYHHALHDRFEQARDMMLMSHLQDSIHYVKSASTQILFNRVMAQIGLSAFRCGLVSEAYRCLGELCSNNRLKERLAQGVLIRWFGDKTRIEEQRNERRCQTPYHMHINLDLVECCHLVATVLVEIPRSVSSPNPKRGVTSRTLKRLFDMEDCRPLSTPPETSRDLIVAGARALERGDWCQCESHILSLPVWSLLGTEECVLRVKQLLKDKIREEALRIFLFLHSACYDALSLLSLGERFELPKAVVTSIVSRMIVREELFASLDQPSGSIVMQRKERLHHLAEQFASEGIDTLKLLASNKKTGQNKLGDNHRQGGHRDPNKQGGAGGSGQQWGGQKYDWSGGGHGDHDSDWQEVRKHRISS